MPPKKRKGGKLPQGGAKPPRKSPRINKGNKDNEETPNKDSASLTVETITQIAAEAAKVAVTEALAQLKNNDDSVNETQDKNQNKSNEDSISKNISLDNISKDKDKDHNKTDTNEQDLLIAQQNKVSSSRVSKDLPASSAKIDSNTLPRIDIVSENLRRDILQGKDVNLAMMLIPEGSQHRSVQHNGMSIDLRPLTDHRLTRPLTIQEFITAFNMYKNIICDVFPGRRGELDTYLSDIIEMSMDYGGFGFYDYHKAFSARANQYLVQQNVHIDWGKRDERLFNKFVCNRKPNSCGSVAHTTPFCPEAASRPYRVNPAAATAQKAGIAKADMRGRNIVYVGNKQVCNNFNSVNGCILQSCPRAHVCLKCLRAHEFGEKCPQPANVNKSTK